MILVIMVHWHLKIESVLLHADLPLIADVVRNAAFVTEGTWFPRCSGAFLVVCLDILQWVAYPLTTP